MKAPSKPRKPHVRVSMPVAPKAARDPKMNGARPPRQITSEPFKEDGTYAIDGFAASVPWRSELEPRDGPKGIDILRHMVAQAGHDAQEWAAHDVNDAGRRVDAVGHLDALGQIERMCRQIQGRDVEPFEHHFVIRPATEGLDPDAEIEAVEDAFCEAGAELEDIARLAGELATAIAALRDRRPIGRAYNPNSRSPLIHRFVEHMAISWFALTGEKAPVTKGYAELLYAAWQSLDFPDLGKDADPVETFRRIHKAKTQAQK